MCPVFDKIVKFFCRNCEDCVFCSELACESQCGVYPTKIHILLTPLPKQDYNVSIK